MEKIHKKNKYCFIQFKIIHHTLLGKNKNIQIKLIIIKIKGEEIRIVGDIKDLGNWDPNKSQKLITNKFDYPLWKSKENIKVKQNSEINYKYLIFQNGKFKRWEEIPNNKNRIIHIKNYVRVVISDVQSNMRKYIKFIKSYNIKSYNIKSYHIKSNYIKSNYIIL